MSIKNKCEFCLNRYDNFSLGFYECLFYGLDIEMCLKDEQVAFCAKKKPYLNGLYGVLGININ